MTSYRKVENCGPVPYPDQSGRYLTTEIVSGLEWEPLVALGYVVAVEADLDLDAGKRLPAIQVEKLAEAAVTAAVTTYKVIKPDKLGKSKNHKNDIINKAESKSAKVDNAGSINRGSAQKVDRSETGRLSNIEPTTPEDTIK